jgi:urease accessory protein
MSPDLMLLVDGRLPTGAHAHSAGVEGAVGAGDVVDIATLARYLDDRLATTGRVDAAFAASAATPCRDSTGRTLDELDVEYTARVLSPYLRATSRRQGRQLLRAAQAVWPDAPTIRTPGSEGAHHAIVLGLVVAGAGGAPVDAASLVLHHLGAAVCSAGVRLLGLDPLRVAAVQCDSGRRAARVLHDVDRWLAGPPSALPADGGLLTEILGEHHGSDETRMFVA